MASKEQLMQALDRADAAGDVEAAQSFASQIKALGAAPVAPKAPADTGSFLGNMVQGAIGSAAGVGSNIIGAATYIPKGIMKAHGMAPEVTGYLDRIPNQVKEFQDDAKGVGGFIGGLAGDIAATGGVGGLVKTGATRAAAMLPATMARTAQAITSAPVRAGVEGAISGAALSPEDQGKGAAWGAGGGVVGQQVLKRTLGRFAKPVQEAGGDAELLRNLGVPLTVGMAADPNTWRGRALRFIEGSAAAVPFLGAGIKAQREAARAGFRDVPIREVAEAAKIPVPPRVSGVATSDMLEQMGKDIGGRYDQLLGARELPVTRVFRDALDNVIADPKLGMTPAARDKAKNMIEAHLFERMKAPGMENVPPTVLAADIFKAQSDLRKIASKSMKSDRSDERAYAQMLTNAADEVYNALERRFPRQGGELSRLRQPFSELSILKKTAKEAGLQGEFNPSQLGQAAGANDAWLHMSRMAEPLLTKDPSGLGGTASTAVVLGGSHLLSGMGLPIGAMLGLGLGTKAGQRTLQGDLAWQRKLSDFLADHPELIDQAGAVAGREMGLGASKR